MRPILLLGAHGQLGRALQVTLAPLGPVLAISRQDLDLSDLPALARLLAASAPRAIVNAAAYTAVDAAEQQADLCQHLNAQVPAYLAHHAAQQQIALLHFSSDYVFDGRLSRAYTEDDAAAPLSVYGRSKLAGDQAVMHSAAHAAVLRSGWLYSPQGKNFLTTILKRLRLAPTTPLRIVADAYGSPTSHARLAQAGALTLARLLKPGGASALARLYHVAASGRCSWYEYAEAAVQQAVTRGLLPADSRHALQAIAAVDWPAPAARPAQSQLDSCRFQQDFHYPLPDWRTDLHHAVDQLALHPEWLLPH